MIEKPSYGKQIRESLIGVNRRFIDDNFLYILESQYIEDKNKISNNIDNIKENIISLFCVSSILFTFGRLDVAEDILNNLENVKYGKSRIYKFAAVINLLLPLPCGFSCFKNCD